MIRCEQAIGQEARINSFCSGTSLLDYYTSSLPSANTPVLRACKNVDIRLQDEPLLYELELRATLHDMRVQRAPRGPSRLSTALVVLLVRLPMELEVNALGQTQSSIDCGAAMRSDTTCDILLLNRPDAEGSPFQISLILSTGSRRKGITVQCSNILFNSQHARDVLRTCR